MTIDHPFLTVCQQSGLVVDANILNIFIVGLVDPQLIPRTKATAKYYADDFALLVKLFDHSKRIVISPYVLPEVSNTLPLDKKNRTDSSPFLLPALQLLSMQKVSDQYFPFANLLRHPLMARFGFSDISLLELAKLNYAVITNDFALCNVIRSQNLQAINLPELRAQKLILSR